MLDDLPIVSGFILPLPESVKETRAGFLECTIRFLDSPTQLVTSDESRAPGQVHGKQVAKVFHKKNEKKTRTQWGSVTNIKYLFSQFQFK